MRVLITSGGTRIPIDRVRHLTNMSRGTFGSRIARAALEANHNVTFMCAKGSRTPMKTEFNLYPKGVELDTLERFVNLCRFYETHKRRYEELYYQTYDEYQEELKRALTECVFDAVILAAAVSDYGVKDPHPGKIRTKEQLTIQLEPLPKLIGKIREWAGDKIRLIGFKLLVDSTREELIEAAWKQLEDNGCDLVVGNDLDDIQRGDHMLTLLQAVKPREDMFKLPMIHHQGQPMRCDIFQVNFDDMYLAKKVVQYGLESPCPGV